MPKHDEQAPPSFSEMEERIRSMPHGPERTALTERLASLKHAVAMHRVLTDEIADRGEGGSDA